LDKIPENKILHIYCRSGARAKTAMSIIRNSGRGRDFVLTSKDGIDAIAKENNINLAPKV
jgi:rhodanese-related sulfurtransferase